MGTDINGLIGHSVPFPPTEELARSMCAGIKPVSSIFKNDWALASHDGTPLIGVRAHGLSVRFGPHAAIVPTGYGWPRPTGDADERVDVLASIRTIGRFFRSPRAIFLPDDIEPWCFAESWIAEGLTLAEIQDRMAKIRPPSADFHAAIRQGALSYEVDGYVVEELCYG